MLNKKIIFFTVICIAGWIGFSQTTLADQKTSRFQDTKKQDQQRVISLGGGITEIIYALEAQDQLVAVDITSYWPKAAKLLPDVGYFRAISAEGILSLSPDLILMTSEAGPPAAIEQLRSVNVPVTIIPADKTPEGVVSKIQSIAEAINLPERGSRLIEQVNADFEKLENLKQQIHSKPRVVFLFSVAKGSLLAAGSKTAADAMIKFAAGENVFSEYTGYKPVNSEVLIAAAPDVLLLTDRVLDSVGGIEGVLNFPGVSLTPAGKNKRIIVMDTLYLLGFGPRMGKAAVDLTQQLHPELMRDKNK